MYDSLALWNSHWLRTSVHCTHFYRDGHHVWQTPQLCLDKSLLKDQNNTRKKVSCVQRMGKKLKCTSLKLTSKASWSFFCSIRAICLSEMLMSTDVILVQQTAPSCGSNMRSSEIKSQVILIVLKVNKTHWSDPAKHVLILLQRHLWRLWAAASCTHKQISILLNIILLIYHLSLNCYI